MTTPPDPNSPWSRPDPSGGPSFGDPTSSGATQPDGTQPEGTQPNYPPPYPPNPDDPAGGSAYPGAQYPGGTYPGGTYPGGGYPGWTYPLGAYGPGQYGPGQYGPGPYGPGPYGAPAGYPADPLVPHPYGGIGAWWSQLWAAFGRNWRALALIGVITTLAPGIVYDVLLANVWQEPFTIIDRSDGTESLIMHWHAVWVIATAAVAISIATTFIGALGSAAATWIIVRRAAGAPASLGTALRYGLRRFGRLGGILVVVAIMTFFGIIACLIPGLYVIVATSLVIPCALFERGSSAIAGSFRLVNRNFGGVLGRVLLTWLLASVPSVVAYCFGGFSAAGNAGLAVDALADSSPSAADSIGSTVFSQILSVPTTMFVIAATLATYAQMRSREAWTSVADLNTALDRTDATRW